MVDKIQPYNLSLWLFRDKTLKQTLDLTCELETIKQNSFTPNSKICVALESYEQESPKTQQHNMIIVCRKTCNAYKASTMRSSKMELSNKPWLDHTSNHYKIVTIMLIHTWYEHPNIQANKLNANHLHVQHSTNTQYMKYMHLGTKFY